MMSQYMDDRSLEYIYSEGCYGKIFFLNNIEEIHAYVTSKNQERYKYALLHRTYTGCCVIADDGFCNGKIWTHIPDIFVRIWSGLPTHPKQNCRSVCKDWVNIIDKLTLKQWRISDINLSALYATQNNLFALPWLKKTFEIHKTSSEHISKYFSAETSFENYISCAWLVKTFENVPQIDLRDIINKSTTPISKNCVYWLVAWDKIAPITFETLILVYRYFGASGIEMIDLLFKHSNVVIGDFFEQKNTLELFNNTINYNICPEFIYWTCKQLPPGTFFDDMIKFALILFSGYWLKYCQKLYKIYSNRGCILTEKTMIIMFNKAYKVRSMGILSWLIPIIKETYSTNIVEFASSISIIHIINYDNEVMNMWLLHQHNINMSA